MRIEVKSLHEVVDYSIIILKKALPESCLIWHAENGAKTGTVIYASKSVWVVKLDNKYLPVIAPPWSFTPIDSSSCLEHEWADTGYAKTWCLKCQTSKRSAQLRNEQSRNSNISIFKILSKA